MKIYAHRGSFLIWPENTMLAFENANSHGAHAFETDLRLSVDGEIILAHDDNLARFGQPEKTISKMTVEEIVDVKIPSIDGKIKDNIITLRHLLQRFPEKDYIFDCKITSEPMMGILRALLDELSFSRKIWFLTWDEAGDRLVETVFPGYEYFPRESISRRWALASIVGLGGRFEPDNSILALPAYHAGLRVFRAAQVAALHAQGRLFLGYLVNDRRSWEWSVRCGVDTILTDRVDLISQYLKEG